MQQPTEVYYHPPGTNTQMHFPSCLHPEIFKHNQQMEGNESLAADEERNFSQGPLRTNVRGEGKTQHPKPTPTVGNDVNQRNLVSLQCAKPALIHGLLAGCLVIHPHFQDEDKDGFREWRHSLKSFIATVNPTPASDYLPGRASL